MSTENTVPSLAAEAVLVESTEIPASTPKVKGYDFEHGVNYDDLLRSFATMGFQATNFGKAVEEVNKMVTCGIEEACV